MKVWEKLKLPSWVVTHPSLVDTLEGAFGSIDQETISIASIPKAKETVTEDVPSTPSPTESGPIGVELVFPHTSYSWNPRIPITIFVDLKHSHVIDVNSLIVLKYFSKKQQLVLMFTMTI